MPHFHIPLQSGSDKILTLMRRRYKRSTYLECVKMIKDVIPDATIGADVIVVSQVNQIRILLKLFNLSIN